MAEAIHRKPRPQPSPPATRTCAPLAHCVEKRCARFPPYAPASRVGWMAEASHRKPWPPALPPATRARAPSSITWKSAARVFHPTLLRAAWGGWPKPATESPSRQLCHLPFEPAHPRPLRGKALRAFSTLRSNKPRRVDGRSQPPKAPAAAFAICHSNPRALAHYVEKRCARFPPCAPASRVGWMAEASHRKPRPRPCPSQAGTAPPGRG